MLIWSNSFIMMVSKVSFTDVLKGANGRGWVNLAIWDTDTSVACKQCRPRLEGAFQEPSTLFKGFC
jgi:hypothetical protein